MIKWFKYDPPTPVLELRDEMEDAATASSGYFIMLALAATLATFGLIADSAAVIIGAMLIAPLMNPVIACSFACARGNWRILRKSIFSITTGIGVVLAISISITRLVDSQFEGAELLTRANPSLLDLGIAIASGVAGAIAWSRKRIANSLPGVAIAVALLPPLCAAGIGIALGDDAVRDPVHSNFDEIQNIELGALVLFFTNFAAILLFGGLVFLAQGYGRIKRATIGISVSIVIIAILAVPLSSTFKILHLRSKTMDSLHRLEPEFPGWKQANLNRIQIDPLSPTELKVTLKVDAPVGVITGRDVAAVERELSGRFDRKVTVEVLLTEYERVTVNGYRDRRNE